MAINVTFIYFFLNDATTRGRMVITRNDFSIFQHLRLGACICNNHTSINVATSRLYDARYTNHLERLPKLPNESLTFQVRQYRICATNS